MDSRRPGDPSRWAPALWSGVVLLSVIGIGGAITRGVFLRDFATRADPLRQKYLDALGRTDPHAEQRAENLRQFDARFAAHPALTVLHILPGGLVLALAPLQFSARIRSRHIRFHRCSGRILVVAAVLTGLPGLFFGLTMPFGGLGEAIATGLLGGLFLFALIRAVVAIRRRDVVRHREWMLRGFAIAAGTATVRAVAPVLDVALTPSGYHPQEIFALSLWTGWLLTLGGAELWIRRTRSQGLAAVAA